MIKKIINAFLIALLIGFTSCNEEDIIYDTPNGFLQVDATTASISENDPNPIITTVLLGKTTNNSDLTVNFQVNSSDASRYSVSPASGQIVIPAGEFSAEITLTTIDNFETDGDLEVEILLLESEGIPVGLGGEGINFHKRVITIIDDDCPLEINDWVGEYAVLEVITGGPNTGLALATAFGEFYQLNLALQPGDATASKLVITNSGDEFLPNGTVLSLISCSGTISLAPSPTLVALFANFTITSSSYNETTFTITADGNLGATRTYQFILQKL